MSDNQWVVFNDFTTTFKTPIVLTSKNQKDHSFLLFDVVPNAKVQIPTTFRFTVKGIDQFMKQEVYAFIDLKLSP